MAIAEALRLAWPRALTFQELLDAARPKAKKTTTDAQLGEEILTHLVLLLNANALCYRLEPVGYAHEEPQPRWIPGLTHLRAIDIQGSRMIGQYNLWHQSLRPPVDEVHRFVGQHRQGHFATRTAHQAARCTRIWRTGTPQWKINEARPQPGSCCTIPLV